jgi:V8-like Glu-specific endopeptidase
MGGEQDMRTSVKLAGCILCLVLVAGWAALPPPAAESLTACGQDEQGWLPHHIEQYSVDSGAHDGGAETSGPAFHRVIRVPGAAWLRLHFGDYRLGVRSYVTITSLQDGGSQRHDAASLPQWGNASAYLNGDAAEVELHVAQGEEGIFFRIDEVTVGERVGGDAVPTTICGTTDDRVASADRRVGRLSMVWLGNFSGICTAWLVSNGALVTAGHCVDGDPDGSGPLLPDGILDLDADDIVEFNVPASLSNGTPVFAHPNDQYPINLNRVSWHFDGEGQGLGKDWAVFAVHPNSNTGLLPQQAQGAFFRMTRERPSVGATIRVTGYGADNSPPGSTGGYNAQNYTEQTHTGPYQGEFSTGGNIWHEHRVDTTGGSSGSPIIWESTGFAIGVHTNGGCTTTGGANAGTSFEHDPLEDGLQAFPGPNVIYVDLVSIAPAETGSVLQPFNTVLEAASTVPSGGLVSIVTGSYNEQITINRAMTLAAPVGGVVIGR